MAENPMPELLPEDGLEQAIEKPKPPKKKGGIGLIIITALVVAPMGAGFVTLKSKQAAQAVEKAAEWAKDRDNWEVVTVPMEAQTVNLADGDRYARFQIALAFEMDHVDAEYLHGVVAAASEEGDKGGHGEGEGKQAASPYPKTAPSEAVEHLAHQLAKSQTQLKDATLREVSKRKYRELLSEADKNALAAALVIRYKKILHAESSGASHADEDHAEDEHDTKDSGKKSSKDSRSDSEVEIPLKDVYFQEFIMQ